jgi:hypothetical protein
MEARSMTIVSRRKILIGAASLAASEFAISEQCWQLGGCENLIGWFRVNKYVERTKANMQDASTALFGTKSLPRVNSTVTIRRVAYLRRILWGESSDIAFHDKQLKKGEIQNWEPQFPSADPQSDYMAPGTKVRILSYHSRDHLFALIQVISYSSRPYETAKAAKYDFDQVI